MNKNVGLANGTCLWCILHITTYKRVIFNKLSTHSSSLICNFSSTLIKHLFTVTDANDRKETYLLVQHNYFSNTYLFQFPKFFFRYTSSANFIYNLNVSSL